MAAGIGSTVEYLDYNQIQTIINNVFGMGSGDAGYGQTVTSSQVAQHAVVLVTQWNSLRNDLLKARQHQSGVDESGNLGLPTLDIKLTEADRAAYLGMATLINNNRTITPPSSEASLVTLITSSRASGWSGTVSQTITIEFGTANNLRWFFNSGGNFQVSASLTNYATTGDSRLVSESWNILLRNMGIIKLTNSSTTNSGTGTPATNIGYANLTSTNQVIFSKLVEAGNQYTPNRYDLLARIQAGTALVFTPTWSYVDAGNDDAYRVFEPVVGTLNSICQMYIATGSNVAVAYPQVQFVGPSWTYTSAYAVPPPSYSIRPNVTLVNEGATVTYTVNTDNIINGTVLSWRNVGTSVADDFTDGVNSGTVTITSDVGTIVRPVRSDLTTEFVSESIILQLFLGSTATATDAIFTSSGSWVCPAGVTSVSIVAIGAGSAGGSRPVSGGAAGGATGGGGGGLAYINNYTVIPGQSYGVVVGTRGNTYTTYQQYLDGVGQGGPTYFTYLGNDIIRATAGVQGREYSNSGNPSPNPAPIGGTWSGITGTVGYNGGQGGGMGPGGGGGGGGVGGYTGPGGAGGTYSGQVVIPLLGGAGSNGGAGAQGGQSGGLSSGSDPGIGGSGGGGIGLFGSIDYSVSARGGETVTAMGGGGSQFGGYGGGGGGHGTTRDSGGGAMAGLGGAGANGALRIVYGSQRAFPATGVATSVVENVFTGDPLAIADTVTISDTSLTPVVYSITPNVTLVSEGDPVVFNITTTGVTNGTLVYWKNVGTTAAADFSNTDSGSVAIQGSTASITRTATADLTTEGEETIVIQLRSGNANGPLEVTSVTVRVIDTSTTPLVPSYDVAPSITSVNEGSSLTFYVTTSNVPNGTRLYWSINTNAGDFAVSSGDFLINTNGAQFSVTPTADSTTESAPESFSVAIRTVTGTVAQPVATSATVNIGDTSQTPAPYVPPYEPPYVQPTLNASARGPYFNYIIYGAGAANTKAYWIEIFKDSNASIGGQTWSVTTTAQLNGKISSWSSGSGGSFSPAITEARVGFNSPHESGNVYVTVSAPGYTSYQATINIPANANYSPYTYNSGWSQQYGRTGSALNPLAVGLGEGIYRSVTNAWTVDYNDGEGPKVRYSFGRAPDAGGLNHWVSYCLANGYNWDTPAFVNVIIQSGEINGERTQNNTKPYVPGTGYGDFLDRPQ